MDPSLWTPQQKEIFLAIESVAFLLLAAVSVIFTLERFRRGETSLLPAARLRWWLLGGFLGVGAAVVADLGPAATPIGGALGLLVVSALLHPANALTFFVASLTLRPWEVFPESSVLALIPRVSGLLALGLWTLEALRRRDPGVRPVPANGWFAGLALWLLLSCVKANDPRGAADLWLAEFGRAAFVFCLVQALVRGAFDAWQMKASVVVSVLGLSGIAIARTLIEGPMGDDERLRAFGLLGNANDIAAVVIQALPFLMVPCFRRRLSGGWALRVLLALSMGLGVTALWMSRSRGALLGLLVVVGVSMIGRMRRERRVVAMALSLVLGALFVPLTQTFRRSEGDLKTSSAARVNYWRAGINMAISNPTLGVGYGMYPSSYETFAPTLEHEWGERTAHSSWILVLAEAGWIALLCFLALYGEVLRRAWRLRETQPELLYSVIGYGVAMSFLSHSYLIYPYVLFGLVLSQPEPERR